MNIDIAYKLVLIFSFFGILDTLYIAYHNYTNTDVWCPIFPKEWCKKVQYSKYSKTFGIPNGFLGVALYVLVFDITCMYLVGMDLLWVLKLLSAFGFAFAVYFTAIQAFVLRAFCVWCIISAINLSVIFLSLFFLV